jgi:1,4-alpha-glucan branching enzyme
MDIHAPLFHIEQKLGAVISDNNSFQIQFRLFFPSDPDPQIASIRVAGSFQSKIGGQDWSFDTGPQLTAAPQTQDGVFWTLLLGSDLPVGFYEYKYQITFKDPNVAPRIVTDPYARYSGQENQNSGFVIGGQDLQLEWLKDRKPISDLVVYELHIGDFTVNLDKQRVRAPLDVVIDKLDYLKDLGFNAILFEPWTAWPDKNYNWGYTPFQYFAVEYAYANDPNKPEEKISWLKKLISECHKRDIHVIMDGVYDHADVSFPYKNFYQDPASCPYTAEPFGGANFGQDLDFNNYCTQAFIRDVCLYWISEFKIDGIRFDDTVDYHVQNNPRGIPELLLDIESYVASQDQQNFSTTIENLQMDAASVTNQWATASFWDNGLMDACNSQLWNGPVSGAYLSALNDTRFLDDEDKRATLYLTNHDHASVAYQAGLNPQIAGNAPWARTQPHAIALLTSPCTPLIPMGQEFGVVVELPENDSAANPRVQSRPLAWDVADSDSGRALTALYKDLLKVRADHPALRSRNFYPPDWQNWMTELDPASGYGVDVANNVILYRRWGPGSDGVLEHLYVILNFSGVTRDVMVLFEEGGRWENLITGGSPDNTTSVSVGSVADKYKVTVSSNWGAVFFQKAP